MAAVAVVVVVNIVAVVNTVAVAVDGCCGCCCFVDDIAVVAADSCFADRHLDPFDILLVDTQLDKKLVVIAVGD
jgi:hypothetical protein